MRIILNSTNDFVEVNGVRCRMWDGLTSNGTPIQAAIVRVAPIEDAVIERALNIHDFGTEDGLSINDRFIKESRASGLIPPSELHQHIVDVK